MNRRIPIIVGAVLVLGAASWIVWRLAFRDTTTPVSASEVVDQVTGTPTTGPAETTMPVATTGDSSDSTVTTAAVGFVVGEEPGDPGLYVYETTGSEQIDALGGASHDYPPETFLTIQPGGCGIITRWTALEERWSEHELCPSADGLRLAGFESYHEWFSRPDLQDFTCDPATALVSPVAPEQQTWTYECTTGERTERWDVEVLGIETLQVGGESVDSLHVRVTSALEGASEGTSDTHTWYLPGTGLVLKRIAQRSSVNESLIGEVHYQESFEINLTSLRPRGVLPGS